MRADGIFGPQTEAAVRRFQQGQGLVADGVVGTRSWSALHRSRAASPGFDPFNPEDYARWLSQGTVGAMQAIGGLFGARAGTNAGTAVQARAPAAPARPHVAAARPHAATSGAQDTPRPPQISPSTNSQHSRMSFPGYQGRGFVVHGYERYRNWEVRLAGSRIVRPWTGQINNECAQFVQLFGVPRTTFWRRGPQVCHMAPGSLPVGTVVATLRDGVYHSDYSGRSHVGIYLGHDTYDPARGNRNAGGVRLMDQYNHAPISERRKAYSVDSNAAGRRSKGGPWTDAAGHRHTNRVSWTSDGEEYFVLMVG